MSLTINRAAVVGSGVMGSTIAAHLVNCGISTLLLDIVPNKLTEAEKQKGFTLQDVEVRNRLTIQAKEKLLKQKPAPLTSKKNIQLLEVGNIEDHLDQLKEVDWIIEVVIENLNIKKKLLAKIDQARKQGSIVSSNTSGISIGEMSEECSADFKKHFLGTHFFNPPRYLKLLELIPTQNTSSQVLQFMKTFAENVLGKGVVIAKDTPNFIANRIGIYSMLITVQEMERNGLSIGEVDSITGPMIGRPKSATFRTLDVVGLDTFIHVANNIYEKVDSEEKEIFKVPNFMIEMNKRGWIGSKSGQGFYIKKKTKSGKEILELNPATLEYQPRQKLKTLAIKKSKQEKSLVKKIQTLIYADDVVGTFLWNMFKAVLLYSAKLSTVIADDLVSIDRAMKWGFGWELGPFELWDAIGLEKSVERMKAEGEVIPEWVTDMLQSGKSTFYRTTNGEAFYYHHGNYHPLFENPKVINIKRIKDQKGVIKKNSGASFIDLEDGIALLEFHSPNEAIGLDAIQMIHFAIDEVERNYQGLVIGNQGRNFCVGANIGLILMEAQDDNFMEIDLVVRQFQYASMRLKYCQKPIVSAPFGMTLGGGTEICLPTARTQASSETYMGLVETGVGLIPGGGGNKELYLKLLESIPGNVEIDLQKIANRVFETIALASVSTSAVEARDIGFLQKHDRISINEDHLLYDAKQIALFLANNGYQPPLRQKVPVVGEIGYATMVMGAQAMYESGYITEHDLKIAKKLARVISGGRLPFKAEVDENYLLDLEREAFLSLVGEPKTRMRMQHMLKKGKPLRN